jgi:hypothetical protein
MHMTTKKTDVVRGDAREEDPRKRARDRVAALRENGLDLDGVADKFYIPADAIPEGWTYEWKRWRTYGKEDPTYEVEMSRRGWEPVPAGRHPEMVPSNWTGHHIELDGMILMERPEEITIEFRENERRKALAQVRAKEEQLAEAPPGAFERVDAKGQSTVKVKKSFAPMAIPKE